MFVRRLSSRTARRGVVLILILGMLGLLALIGVTFATFSGQAQIGSRKVAEALYVPRSDELMDYALSQLINDTGNPMSALRGHSLKRDMYGNDAFNNGLLTTVPNSNGTPLQITDYALPGTIVPGTMDLMTNIPAGTSGQDFTRWIVRVPERDGRPAFYQVPQTFEVIRDSQIKGVHVLSVTLPGATSYTNGTTAVSLNPYDPVGDTFTFAANQTFVLDGRYLRAFNGTGMTALDFAVNNIKASHFPNFRLNGGLLGFAIGAGNLDAVTPFNPGLIGMDEDYDACDPENMFVAMQSADGQVVIPSFHRPGLVTDQDWTLRPEDHAAGTPQRRLAVRAVSKLLRPRAIDHPASGNAFRDLVPDQDVDADGTFDKITYDVDNDGDGVTDAVWLDLGYPVRRDASGRLFKPLFAFTVLPLNGRLPLNTVGNLHSRQVADGDLYLGPDNSAGTPDDANFPDSDPTFDHASHLGYAVNEINPKFALQNAFDSDPATLGAADNLKKMYRQFDDAAQHVSITQLRNLLTGTRPHADPYNPTLNNPKFTVNGEGNWVVMNGRQYYLPNNVADGSDVVSGSAAHPVIARGGRPVEGRWGEPGGIPSHLDKLAATEPLYRSFNNFVRAGRSPQLVYEPAGDVLQYQVDGVDEDFDSLDFNGESADTTDAAGAILLPSERSRRSVTPIDPTGTGLVLRWNTTHEYSRPLASQDVTRVFGLGADQWGRVGFFHYFRPPGVPQSDVGPDATSIYHIDRFITTFDAVTKKHVYEGLKLNTYHGYDSFREPPFPDPPTSTKAALFAAMPFELDNTGNTPPTAVPTQLPTYNPARFPSGINSDFSSSYAVDSTSNVINRLPKGSLNWNEADEMDVYRPNRHDAPFAVHDLEWLYRSLDVDGASLSSRLASLAPISFTNPFDGLTRRRLFSIDSWELNRFVFAHDNPNGADFTNNSYFPHLNANPVLANASFYNMGTATPSVAHGDRKINLNFPLPHSYDPAEPVRRKWISETYALLKAVLPPQATDMPEELAALGQFVVNIVDFRDPDNAITIWTNPDVQQTPARVGASGAEPPKLHLPKKSDNTDDPDYDTDPKTNQGKFLVQYGMEYCPIALNEVLAYQFNYKDSAKSGPDRNSLVNRMFVELVNTLSRSGSQFAQNPSDLDLTGWEFVLMKETDSADTMAPHSRRPDPATGQVPPGAPTVFPVVVSTGRKVSADPKDATVPSPVADDYTPLPTAKLVPGLQPKSDNTADNAPNYYYTIGGTVYQGAIPAPDVNENPNIEDAPYRAVLDYPDALGDDITAAKVGQLVPPTADVSGAPGQYFWLYLRRPANPFDPLSPKVVVDSIRFPFTVAGGRGRTDPQTGKDEIVNELAHTIYSLQRLQPYRGGQGVPDASTLSPPYPYGYTEQTAPPAPGKRQAVYGTAKYKESIRATIGEKNNPSEPRDYLVFHDRDFTSVAELLMVPGCPPGLFTKKFVERNPPITPTAEDTGSATPPATVPTAATPFNDGEPHPFPYLVDNFYYMGAAPTAAPPFLIGGPTGAGWHRMLEFFEVPSSARGSIGPVAQGENFDWQRQDLKPGLLNLNMIIDEEVFFGLIDDPRLNLDFVASAAEVPRVVTQVDASGTPVAGYPISDLTVHPAGRGFTYFLDATSNIFDPNPTPDDLPTTGLKRAFADFLKLRHGGSGFMFAYGNGLPGTPYEPGMGSSIPADPRVAAERPFHSLSCPDINYTVMRPATLEPSAYTNPPLTGTPPPGLINPGVKNANFSPPAPYTSPPTNPPVPPIPPRRLLQISDVAASDTESNASLDGFKDLYLPVQNTNAGAPTNNAYRFQNPPWGDATSSGTTVVNLAQHNAAGMRLGGGTADTDPSVEDKGPDRRRHPNFRIEWLQKVMNLTTVRSHQYAVWVTVGLFEVRKPGNPLQLTPDQLGPELDAASGRNVRYRSFFVLDRTRATGYNPNDPGDFREVVVYRRRIE